MKNLIFLLIAISSTSCMSTIMDDDYSDIDYRIKPYVDDVLKEGKERGFEFDMTTVKICFGKTLPKDEAITIHVRNMIVVDSASYMWKHTPNELIAHELGHLLLHRKHDDSEIAKRTPKSVMSTNTCFYENEKRVIRKSYYMDELFDPSTPRPDWLN